MTEGEGTIPEIMEAMLQKHIPFIEEAGKQGVQILCFQEIFNTPYFCPGQDAKWYASAETVPGPTTERMAEYAKEINAGLIVVATRNKRGFSGLFLSSFADRILKLAPCDVLVLRPK